MNIACSKKVRSGRVRSAFTLIELLVVIAIIAILAAILFPVFAQAREKARQAACLSNTKQLGLGIYQYIQDYDETLPLGGWGIGPYGSRWFRDIYPYVKNVGVYVCPSMTEDKINGSSTYFVPTMAKFPQYDGDVTLYPQSSGGYAINANLVGYPYNSVVGPPVNPPYDSKPLADIKDSAGTFLVCEASAFSNAILGNNDAATWVKYQVRNSDWQVTPPTNFTGGDGTRYTLNNSNYLRRPAARHNGGINVIYCDGHSKWSRVDRFLGPLTNDPPGWPYGDANNSWDNK